MFAKDNKQKKLKKSGGMKETISVIVQAILLALVIRTFLFQPFTIPSGSMRPTLLVGDYLFVSKFSYGYSKYSLPLSLNLFSGRFFGAEPKRGDVVVFRLPSDTSQDYIKRVIGLPGDRVQVRQGVLYVNDVAISRELVGQINDYDITELNRPVNVYRETMDNGVQYNTLDIGYYPMVDDTKIFEVPEGHFFMMGDNRDNSDDSRLHVGYVPYENLIGRANLIFFSIGNGSSAWELWAWPFDVRWGRIFSFVQKIQYFPPNG